MQGVDAEVFATASWMNDVRVAAGTPPDPSVRPSRAPASPSRGEDHGEEQHPAPQDHQGDEPIVPPSQPLPGHAYEPEEEDAGEGQGASAHSR